MNKSIFIILLVLPFTLRGQTHNTGYMGDNYNSYLGAEFRINPDYKHYFSLYGTEECAKNNNFNGILFNKNGSSTDINSVLNYVFTLDSITEHPFYPIFWLRNTSTNNLVFFKYDTMRDFNFPFIVKLNANKDDFYKSMIEKRFDEIDNKTIINSPYRNPDNSKNYVRLFKYITNGTSTYYLSLDGGSMIPDVTGKGVVILFQDGDRINKPSVPIEISVNENGGLVPYDLNAWFKISQSDLQRIKGKKIKKYRLGTHDVALKDDESEIINIYINSVIEAK